MTCISRDVDCSCRGYDLREVVTAGVPVQLGFIADEAGEFPAVLEESGVELLGLGLS